MTLRPRTRIPDFIGSGEVIIAFEPVWKPRKSFRFLTVLLRFHIARIPPNPTIVVSGRSPRHWLPNSNEEVMNCPFISLVCRSCDPAIPRARISDIRLFACSQNLVSIELSDKSAKLPKQDRDYKYPNSSDEKLKEYHRVDFLMDFHWFVWRSCWKTWDTWNQRVALSNDQWCHLVEAWVYSPEISKDIRHKMSSRLTSRNVEMGEVEGMRKQQITHGNFLTYVLYFT